MKHENAPFHIVGVGASAGGIEALERFFKHVPMGSGLGFVIVTHLSPERESLLHEIVRRYTDMEVHIASDGALVVPNTVHVLPANAVLGIEDRRLRLRPGSPGRPERKPVDIFLTALAADVGERAVGVILSGADGDGTMGIKAVKERGGVGMAQISDGSRPAYPGMPDSAIATGLIDYAVSVEDMGPKLVEIARGFEAVDGAAEAEGENDTRRSLHEIYRILRERVGHDFSGYKLKTFLRRVQRRMHVCQVRDLGEYAAHLQGDFDEAAHLFRDLLINVTGFFRDPLAFEILGRAVIPRLFEGRKGTDTVRIWVPGCSTGEEAYTIAILAREHMAGLTATPRVQIFATDIDDPALGVARAGRYPEQQLDAVSPERRARFFTFDGGSGQVTKDVRDLCIFSPHSVIRDPPFSRIDLVSCRNLMIYFGPEVQGQVIPTFHYALRTGGYMLLGGSESIGSFGELFVTIDSKNRIYQSRAHAAPRINQLVSVNGGLWRNGKPDPKQAAPSDKPLRQTIEKYVLDELTPAHVVVDRHGDLVYSSPRTSKYLEVPAGPPTRQIEAMVRRRLRLVVRSALDETMRTRQTVRRASVGLESDEGDVQLVAIRVEPLPETEGGNGLFIILFTDLGSAVGRADSEHDGGEDANVTHLENELRHTRERLQAMVEEYETALEELKASNEELISVNEEMQSTNEELEASKEELQSLNEELQTVNAELNSKVDELNAANSDLRNLSDSTGIATVFLDRELIIRSFTPAAVSFFKLIPADRGRPLTDLSSHLAYPNLDEKVREVLRTGETVEEQIRGDDGVHYLVRLVPYQTDNEVSDVVLTLVDISRLVRAEAQQRVLVAELNHRVKNMLAVTIGLAQQTIRQAPSSDAFIEAFAGRLHAMARAYELLSREDWTDASIKTLIEQEIAPFGRERARVEGEDVGLKPRHALSLGMIVHELVTNAAKYGALATADGYVDVSWVLAGEGAGTGAEKGAKPGEGRRLDLLWEERDGPAVKAAITQGFGLKLVEREVGYSFSGTVDSEFTPSGLRMRLTLLLDS